VQVGIPPAPRGVPKIEVTFDIDADGIVNVSARDQATGKEQAITIAASSGLTDSEIENMIREAEKHAEEDKKRKDVIEASNHAEQIINDTEKHMGDFKEQLDKAEEEKIREQIKELREYLAQGTESDKLDGQEIKTKTGDLQQASLKVGERRAIERVEPRANLFLSFISSSSKWSTRRNKTSRNPPLPPPRTPRTLPPRTRTTRTSRTKRSRSFSS